MISYEIVATTIRGIVLAVNNLFSWLLEILQNPNIFSDMIANVNPTIIDAIKATAITLCSLFFLLDFFSKTLHLQWVTWENVLMLFIKMFVAKICVDNSLWITDCIYNGLSSMTNAIPSFTTLIPQGGDWSAAYGYFLSGDDYANVVNNTTAGFLDFKPLLVNIQVQIQGFIMQGIVIVATIIVVARFFELTVYSIVAPIPLATFACEGLTDIGKGFLKSYAAVCVQAVVLIIMFFAYTTMDTAFNQLASNIAEIRPWMGMIKVFTLGIAVMQSGSWAKKICGAM